MRIALLSNVNVDSLVKRIDFCEVYSPDGYGIWLQEILNFDSELYKFHPQAVFVILDGEQLFPRFNRKNIMTDIEEYFSALEHVFSQRRDIFFFLNSLDFFTKQIRASDEVREEKFVEIEWYRKLIELAKKLTNVHILNLKDLVEKEGRKNFYSNKLWYLGGMKYSTKGEKLIIKEIERSIKALKGEKKKCLAIDLDNTIWGGVIGEDGIEGIELSEFKEGARYKDFQKRLKEFKNLGVILTVVSKNNEQDALDVFEKHKDMVLKRDDFALMKINWDPKSKNLMELAKELNIGIDSIVFIDDNPVERELVKKSIPEIIVPEFPKDTANLVDFAEEIYNEFFYMLRVTAEDIKKTQMYIQNAKRTALKKKYASAEDFLKDLGTKIYVWKLREEDIPRAAQLTQKTNQFNLTTKRYTETDVRNFMNDERYDVFIASVEDKFGDNGKVVLMILKKDKKRAQAEIDTFLMSCRVMGRHIEDQFIDFIEKKLKKDGMKLLIAFYYPTKKNKPVENLFERLGYTVIKNDNEGNKVYSRNLNIEEPRVFYGELIER
ncbi:MAG: HAD-IIIC family phosphatase [Candidatus Heimdallarchaeota archaeon]